MKIKDITNLIKISAFAVICLFFNKLESGAQPVNSFITEGDQGKLLQAQPVVNFAASAAASTITFNTGTTYQAIDGFGWALTPGSAELICGMTVVAQNSLLNEIFSTSGIGVSLIRLSIGSSDLSSSNYTYNDIGPDPMLSNFSLAGPDMTYLIPLLKKILAINPSIKIMATPWTAPRWMKTNNAWIGGSLNTTYYAAYANYFVKYIQAMQAEGIAIWAITPQNEPEHGGNEPSMVMTSAEQLTFINSHLGPAFVGAGITTKIIAFDHNCDNTAYPIDVLNGSTYVDGAAFHLYAGNITALSTVRAATGKNIYFTEQYTDVGGNWLGDLRWHIINVFIGSTTNWSKTVIEWNLASDVNQDPHTPGGCTTCLGGYTINSSTMYTRNVSYYMVGHFSKFIRPGAVRVNSASINGTLYSAMFVNPDGSKVMVVYNDANNNTTFTVGNGSKRFSYSLARFSVVTFIWDEVPLPLDLIDFKLKRIDDYLEEVKWVTSNEKNVEYFCIETSVDGIAFNSIDTMRAKGLNGELNEYNYYSNSSVSKNYYRLKVIDLDGSFIYSKIIGKTSNTSYNSDNFRIYPNPGNFRDVNVEYTNNNFTFLELIIRNEFGSEVLREALDENLNTFSFENLSKTLPKGVYFLSLTNSAIVKKLVVY